VVATVLTLIGLLDCHSTDEIDKRGELSTDEAVEAIDALALTGVGAKTSSSPSLCTDIRGDSFSSFSRSSSHPGLR
jgi:hypothetical protein